MLPLPEIDRARADELPLIAALRAAEDWAPNRWLLDAVHSWQGGRIFVIRDAVPSPESTHLLAATSAVAYDARGFIGNVLVRRDMRGRGLGKHIMRAALAWLAGRGVRVVELDATPEGRPLYEQLGFVGATPSWALWSPLAAIQVTRIAALAGPYVIAPLAAEGLPALAGLDHRALGGDRLGLLAGVLAQPQSRGYVARDPTGVPVGYLIARPAEGHPEGLRLGPWVASTPDAAAALLGYALAQAGAVAPREPPGVGAGQLHASIPGASQPALDLCAKLGLTLLEDDLRMRLDLDGAGVAPLAGSEPPQSGWIYGMLAPMVG